jgi:hypothetical protein
MRTAMLVMILFGSLGCGARPAPPAVGNQSDGSGTATADVPVRIPVGGETRIGVTLDGKPVELVASISEVDGVTTLTVLVPTAEPHTLRYDSPYRGPLLWVTAQGSSVIVYENYQLCAGDMDEDCDNYGGRRYTWSPEIADFLEDELDVIPVDSLH